MVTKVSIAMYRLYFLQSTYEDSMDLIAKLPSLAALIFRHLYRDGKVAAPLETDWSANFAHMLGTPMLT